MQLIAQKQAHAERLITTTSSLCPECHALLKAEIFEREGRVYMLTNCARRFSKRRSTTSEASPKACSER
jgi:uncharacterized radical SAM superfamily Fe-S cluster-containing enzyme